MIFLFSVVVLLNKNVISNIDEASDILLCCMSFVCVTVRLKRVSVYTTTLIKALYVGYMLKLTADLHTKRSHGKIFANGKFIEIALALVNLKMSQK